jgi:hypothetical protein
MACWLEYECGVRVSQSTISRLSKRSKKEVRRISLRVERRDEEISRFLADDLVFLDEFIFNEKTGWLAVYDICTYRAQGEIFCVCLERIGASLQQ